ncbi:Uncharacterised protein [Chryseobacterium gleum]|uniref:Uncharacterized protein n=2 Tax=Chryseobacterium gleum TaxID=250 RepID=A0A3S4MFG5_CHRGE|nr:hypothetical protein [Chryseobacterium gleum]EFK36862.1 hypothetical protein HMPREF0204_11419 [Chryseobacterium gleum ATCC 35910]QQY32110.1 hypothetical protein I6I60_25315 [Chryseobacterium gleum]VEE10665.1 Uncharacterised protein [Chryseobacterium gleum]
MFKFSLKIDDHNHSLNAEDGISIDTVSDLLKTLYNAIDDGTKAKCTLSSIRGNCYALDFSTENINQKEQFISLHKKIEEFSTHELNSYEQKYATVLNVIFKQGFYINAYSEGERIAKLNKINADSTPYYYYRQKTIYGIISEQGGKAVDSDVKHIIVDGYGKKIKINNELDLQLKKHYRTDKLAIKIRTKVSIKTGMEFSAEIISFRVIGKNTLLENLNAEGPEEFNFLKGINTMDDLLNSIYGYRKEN